MLSFSLQLRSAAILGIVGFGLTACDTALTPFVGQSKEAAARAVPPAAPPAPPPTTAFVKDSVLAPGFAGQANLPPTLPTISDAEPDANSFPAAAGPHQVIAAVPLSADPASLSALSAAANRERGGADMRFVLMVLSPPAADAATLDRNSNAARLAAYVALKVLGDGGVRADHVEVSMATSPVEGVGELRLYRR